MGRRIISIEEQKIQHFYDSLSEKIAPEEERKNLIAYRLKKVQSDYAKITVSDLCKKANIQRSTLYHYLSGKYIPPARSLSSLLDLMHYPADNFFANLESNEEWYEVNIYNLLNNGQGCPNIFELLERFKEYLNNPLSFRKDGQDMRIPVQYVNILKKHIEAYYALLELLHPDEDQTTADAIVIKNFKPEEIEYN